MSVIHCFRRSVKPLAAPSTQRKRSLHFICKLLRPVCAVLRQRVSSGRWRRRLQRSDRGKGIGETDSSVFDTLTVAFGTILCNCYLFLLLVHTKHHTNDEMLARLWLLLPSSLIIIIIIIIITNINVRYTRSMHSACPALYQHASCLPSILSASFLCTYGVNQKWHRK